MKKDQDYYIYTSLLITICFLSILFVVYKIFINDIGIFKCLIYEKYHIYCPGCGCTRALIALFEGKIIKSVYYNPIILYCVTGISIYIITQSIDRITKKKNYIIKYNNKFLYIGIAIMLLNCLIRNILLIKYNIHI